MNPPLKSGAFTKFRMILNLNIHHSGHLFFLKHSINKFHRFFLALPLEVLEVTSPETPSATTLVAESLSDDSGKVEGYFLSV